MHKLRRYFYQNKYQIFKVLGIVIFIIIIIQLTNYLIKENSNKSTVNIKTDTTKANYDNNVLISEKSAVTGNKVSDKQLDNATVTISKFMDYCNKQDLENAYNLITEECKQQIFNNKLETFKKSYYKNVFNGEKVNYTIENWVKDTYRVNMVGDILATGRDDGYSKQDYITVKEENDEYKLNINNYIGYSEINKEATQDDITIEVISKNTYKDYEEYTIKTTNKTETTVQLDNLSSTNTLYIEDSKGVKYSYYNHELTTPMITVPVGQTMEVTIKFYSSYVSTKKIDSIIFSNIILKYEQSSEKMEMKVNL